MKKYLIFLLVLFGSYSLWAGATFSRVKSWVDAEVLTAADLNAEFNNILNNLDPAGVDDYSLSLSQMQSTVDPYPVAVESLATDLKGEIERLRYQILQLKKSIQNDNNTYWYQDTPQAGVFTVKSSSVGINNITPTVALDVVGDVKITGDFTLSPSLSVVSAQLASDMPLGSGYSTVPFGTELIDRNSEFSSGIFTATQAGYYLINYSFMWGSSVSSGRVNSILVKNVTTINSTENPILTSTQYTAASYTYVVLLAVGDTIKLQVSQTSAGSLSLLSGFYATRISIVKII